MHEIPAQVEQALRAQGVTDGEFEELRRTGRIERLDDSGRSMFVQFGAADSAPGASSLTIRDIELDPAALAKLRQYHRFIPREMRHGMERALVEDIDGDGHVGAPPKRHVSDGAASGEPSIRTASTTTDGPFVERRRTNSLLTPLLVALAVVALAYWFITRLG